MIRTPDGRLLSLDEYRQEIAAEVAGRRPVGVPLPMRGLHDPIRTLEDAQRDIAEERARRGER